MNAARLFLPQVRRSIYFIAVRKDFGGEAVAHRFFDAWANHLERLEYRVGGSLPPEAFVLPDSDYYVRAEMVKRKGKAIGSDHVGWQKDHAAFARAHFMDWPFQIPPPLVTNPWFSFRSAREREIIVAYFCKRWVDVSQGISNARDSIEDEAPAMTPNQIMWMYHCGSRGGRDLLGREAMALQGHPWPKLKSFNMLTEGQAANLAGTSHASTTYMAVLMSAIFAWSALRDVDLEGLEESDSGGVIDALS